MRTISNKRSLKRALLVGFVMTLLLVLSFQIVNAVGLSQTIPTAPPPTKENPPIISIVDTIQPSVTTTLMQTSLTTTVTATPKTILTGTPENTLPSVLTVTVVPLPSSSIVSFIYGWGGCLVLIGLIVAFIVITLLRRKKKSKKTDLPVGLALL